MISCLGYSTTDHIAKSTFVRFSSANRACYLGLHLSKQYVCMTTLDI